MSADVVAPALEALLTGVIDYAGIFPPAALTVDVAVDKFRLYHHGDFAWMLRSFVVSGADLDKVPPALDGVLSVLAESDQPRAASIETKAIVKAEHPVYCEVVPSNFNILDDIKSSGCFAKIRTGGLKPEAIPDVSQVAAFVLACADRRLAFKATAGLHHPLRAEYALTYEASAPRAVMHGFLNVLMASALAWHGEKDIEPILADQDAASFAFDDCARWKDKSLTVKQVTEARENFFHSIGSCSFEEPVRELQALGFLPNWAVYRERKMHFDTQRA